MRILMTGYAGFIGSHLLNRLITDTDHTVYVYDTFTSDNYPAQIKRERINKLKEDWDKKGIDYENRLFDYTIPENVESLTEFHRIDKIVHLASIPGVRKSLEIPEYYVNNNIGGFIRVLELAKKYNAEVIYASSSSVYGNNVNVPFKESDTSGEIRSSYACSKKCMEIYAEYYQNVFGIKCIGLRFFTVYGPEGRPDMAPYMFLKHIHEGTELTQYGNGESYRDYTYIDDIIDGIYSIIERDNSKNPTDKIYNLGNRTPYSLKEFIELCEDVVGHKAKKRIIENQLGDVPRTFADISRARLHFGYNPKTVLKDGLTKTYESFKIRWQ
uniref:NAD-dependent epimerase/dehydratase domain-containing protein n=1 Tax=viral metagenome TaxID=1070528 RepID=A0A6C0CIK5_9ZZZZ